MPDDENENWLQKVQREQKEFLARLDPRTPLKLLKDLKEELDGQLEERKVLENDKKKISDDLSSKSKDYDDLKKRYDDLLEKIVRNQKP